MSTPLPPLIQEYLLDPERKFEKRATEIESFLDRLATKAKEIFGSTVAASAPLGDAEKAVRELDATVKKSTDDIAKQFETLAARIENSILAAVNAASSAIGNLTGRPYTVEVQTKVSGPGAGAIGGAESGGRVIGEAGALETPEQVVARARELYRAAGEDTRGLEKLLGGRQISMQAAQSILKDAEEVARAAGVIVRSNQEIAASVEALGNARFDGGRLREEVESLLGVIDSAATGTKRTEALNRFINQFGDDFPNAARLAKTAVAELTNTTGTLEERLNRTRDASRGLTETGDALKSDIDRLKQQRALLVEQRRVGREGRDKLTEAEAEEDRRLSNEIQRLGGLIGKLGIEQNIARNSAKALTEQYRDLEQQVKDTGQAIQTTSTGVRVVTPTRTTAAEAALQQASTRAVIADQTLGQNEAVAAQRVRDATQQRVEAARIESDALDRLTDVRRRASIETGRATPRQDRNVAQIVEGERQIQKIQDDGARAAEKAGKAIDQASRERIKALGELAAAQERFDTIQEGSVSDRTTAYNSLIGATEKVSQSELNYAKAQETASAQTSRNAAQLDNAVRRQNDLVNNLSNANNTAAERATEQARDEQVRNAALAKSSQDLVTAQNKQIAQDQAIAQQRASNAAVAQQAAQLQQDNLARMAGTQQAAADAQQEFANANDQTSRSQQAAATSLQSAVDRLASTNERAAKSEADKADAVSKATNELNAAQEKRATAAQKLVDVRRAGGTEEQEKNAISELTSAVNAETTARNNLNKAETAQANQQQRNATATRQAINAVESATQRLSSANQAGRGGLDAHDRLLLLLGVSRLLPPALSQVTSGLALMSEGFTSTAGKILGVSTLLATVVIQALRAGAEFNKQLNQARALREGLGLDSIAEVRAFQLVLEQTGGSIENFAVGIKKIAGAKTGIGEEVGKVQNLLGLAFGGTDFNYKVASTKDIILELGKNFEFLEKAGLDTSVAYEIFGRSSDEVKGRLKDLVEQERSVEKAVKDSGTTSDEAQRKAKEYAQSITKLEIAWQRLVSSFATPATAIINFVSNVVGGAGESPLLPSAEALNKEKERAYEAYVRDIIAVQQKALKEIEETGESEAHKKYFPAIPIEEFKKSSEETLKKYEQILADIEKKKAEIAKDTPEVRKAEADRKAEAAQAEAAGKQKLLDEKLAGASADEKLAAQRQVELAALEQELQDAQKQLKVFQDAVKYDRTFLQGKIDDNDRKQAALTKLKEDEKNLLAQQIVVDGLRKKAADLRKAESGAQERKDDAARFQLEIQELREKAARLLPGSKEYNDIQAQIQAAYKARIAKVKADKEAGTDPTGLTQEAKLTKEAFKAKQQADEEIARQEATQSARRIERRRELLQEEISDRESSMRLLNESEQRLLSLGAAGFEEVLNNEIERLLTADRDIRSKREGIILALEAEISNTLAKQQQGVINQNEATARIASYEQQIDREKRAIVESKNKESEELRKIEDNYRDRLIASRETIRSIEQRENEEAAGRYLELLNRVSQASVDLKDFEIRRKAEKDRQAAQAEFDAALSHYNDLRKLHVEVEGLGKVSINLPEDIRNATDEQIENQIASIRALGAKAPKELLDLLQKLLEIKQKIKQIDQTEFVETQDFGIQRAAHELELRRSELDIEENILSVREAQNDILRQFNLIDQTEAGERKLETDRERLRMMQERLEALRQEAALEINKQVQIAQTAGIAIDDSVMARILNSDPVERLRVEFSKLNGDMRVLALNTRLADSVLGRISKGLEDAADKIDKIPGPVAKLSGVLRGVRSLVDAFNEAQLKKEKPLDEQLKDGVKEFNATIQQGAYDFVSIIKSGAPVSATGAGALAGVAQKGETTINKFVTKLFDAVGSVADALASGSTGGRIAGFGAAAGSLATGIFGSGFKIFGAAGGPLIAGVTSVIGGLFDFIGGIFKKRAENIANGIQANFNTIMQKFRDGALSLGDTIRGLQGQLESARKQLGSGKVGKKGGKAALAQLEQQAAQQIAELRRQAEETKAKFQQQLKDLRLPPELRDSAQSIRNAFEQVRQYLDSFENAADALKALPEAREFLDRTLGELKESALDELTALLKQEADAERNFQRERLSILNEGRFVTPFQQAQDRLARLFDLEKQRVEQRAAAQKQEDLIQKRIDLIDKGFDRSNKILERMNASFLSFVQKLEGVLGGSNSNALAKLADNMARTQSQSVSQVNNMQVNITTATDSQAVSAGRSVESVLMKYNKINPGASRINSERPAIP